MRPRRAARVALALAVAPHAVAAADWSISGFVSARTEGVAESGGNQPDSGLRATGDLGFTLRARTPTTSLTLSPAARVLLSTLDGDASGEPPLPRILGALGHQATPRLSLNASASVVPDFVDEAQFEDAGERTTRDALQISANGRAGGTYLVDPRQRVSLGAFARMRTYTEDSDGLFDTRAWGLDGAWARDLSPRSTATLSPVLTVFSSDAPSGAEGQSLALQLGGTHRLSERLTLDFGAGPAVTRSERGDAPKSTDLSGTGRLGLRYATPSADYRLGFTQGVEQNADGALENRTALRTGVSARLTSLVRAGFDASAGYRRPFDGEDSIRSFFSVTPQLSYGVSPDWSLSVGYRFRAADRDELETSHTVFLQISRGLSQGYESNSWVW